MGWDTCHLPTTCTFHCPAPTPHTPAPTAYHHSYLPPCPATSCAPSSCLPPPHTCHCHHLPHLPSSCLCLPALPHHYPHHYHHHTFPHLCLPPCPATTPACPTTPSPFYFPKPRTFFFSATTTPHPLPFYFTTTLPPLPLHGLPFCLSADWLGSLSAWPCDTTPPHRLPILCISPPSACTPPHLPSPTTTTLPACYLPCLLALGQTDMDIWP